MIAEAVRRSPLADYAERLAALSAATGGALAISELPFVSQMDLRADANDERLMQHLESALGFALPMVPNTTASRQARRALWLGPDEWLVVAPDGEQATLEHHLRNGLSGDFGAITEVSANRTVIEIRGTKARDLLGHGVPIDLDARVFGPRRCAQTLLAKAQVIVERPDEEMAFHIYVRSSFATYLADWLLDTAAE